MAVPAYNLLSLCAGVGGLDLGIEIAMPGARSIAFVEREAYAAATLAARMEAGDLAQAAIWSDLGTFDARPWRGIVDCVCSGDPCQPNSVAGKRGGADDDRFLIDQVVRIVSECRPRRLFRENVFGNADGQLAALVPALEGLGYRVAAGIFSASEVGASHQRERLFVMADRQDGHADEGRTVDDALRGRHVDADEALRAGRDIALDAGRGIELVHPQRARRTQAGTGPVFDAGPQPIAGSGNMGHPMREGSLPAAYPGIHRGEEGAGPRDAEPERRGGNLASTDGLRRWPQGDAAVGADNALQRGIFVAGIPFAPGPSDARWPDILRDAPQLEPAVRRVANGLADRVDRLRACGNGVFPLAAANAWCALDALLASGTGPA